MKTQYRKRAILIEGDRSLLVAISLILKKHGYEVYAAEEPSFCPIYLDYECQCPAEHACTNIVMINVNPGSSTGLEFIENQKRRGCKVQNIAVMSAAWETPEREMYQGLGCKIFTKPFKMEKLAGWLKKCERNTDPDFMLSELPRSCS